MRLRVLLRLFGALLLIFILQKVLFMLFNLGMAHGAPLVSCMASLWHGLRLDISTACYLVIIPLLALIVSCFFRTFPLRKVLLSYYWLISAVLALIFVADTVLYSFWGAKLDANDLIYAAKPKEMLASLPLWASVMAFVIVAAIAWGQVLILRWLTPKELTCPQRKLLFPLSSILLIAPLIFLGMRGGVTESTANPSYAYFSPHPFCNHAALNPTFNMMHSLFKVQDLGSEFNTMDDSRVAEILSDCYEPDNTLADTLLRIERPNVLLIIWEGAGLGMVGTDSVAPNLHALIPEGVYFSNCYASSYRTDRGLLAVLSGWPGLPTTTLMKRPDLCRNLPSIASSLQQAGYSTSMTYGGDIDFTNMRMYFSETGFAEVHGSEYFPSSMNESAWGVPDHHLFSALNSRLSPPTSPFLITALTLSSHEPWQVPMHRLADSHRNAFAYTDSCIGSFINGLKATSLWDSLLVIIVPDHGIPFEDGQPTHDLSVTRIPMLWIGGALAQKGIDIDILMNQSDLAATLLAQMHLPLDGFTFSRNILGTKYLQRNQFAIHSDKNCLNLVTPDSAYFYDCISKNLTSRPLTLHSSPLTPHSPSSFLAAYLQHLYRTSADLANRR